MVTDQKGYIHLIEYLTKHLSLFENMTYAQDTLSSTIIETIEQELGCQIIDVCTQNQKLSFNQRNDIIREVDSILYDLEEILSAVLNNEITKEQTTFIEEFSLLIKNLFDEAITCNK
jgi:hypothetical protein